MTPAMTLSDIRDLLCCEVYHVEGSLNDTHIQCGCASDLMSDVLAFSRPGAVLLTGLVNVQTIHTAFIAEINAVILVRGKRPTEQVTASAREKHIPVLATPFSMFEACGLLYGRGVPSTMERTTTGMAP